MYKSGQAGIKKASVTITFDNKEKTLSPIGYESYEEITVTRQVVIDGKNKYLINGTNVANKKVQDMFCSVQLNVNNPHFLIMQGRITKVLNMKPLEILSMVEEAAGTRMYEEKKEIAMKTIEKKNNRLKEINAILAEEIGPKLVKLKEERAQFVEFQRVERELEHCRKIVIAFKYVSTLATSKKAEADVTAVNEEIQKKKKTISDGINEIKCIENEVEEIVKRIESDKGTELEMLEQQLKAAEKQNNKLSAEANSNSESIKAEKNIIQQLETNITEDKQALEKKKTEILNVGDGFQKLQDMVKQDSAAVILAQEKLQKISAGLLECDDGENATLEQQLISAKQRMCQAKTEIKQCEMALAHKTNLLKNKQIEVNHTDNDYQRDSRDLVDKEKEYDWLKGQLKNIDYCDGTLQTLEQQRRQLIIQIKNLQDKVESFMMRHHQLRFDYQNPHPNFDRQTVKGLVCTLFKLKDKRTAYALDMAAGGKLYNVVVDTEKTSKALLAGGQLQQRVTIIPLNKITGRAIDDKTLSFAQNLVGKENVQAALSLIDFQDELKPAMTWIFGQTLVCKDMDIAKTVAFHEKVHKRCVTLEGDTCDPSGTLTGGAQSKSGSILLMMDEFKVLQEELNIKEQELNQVNRKIENITKTAEKFNALKQNLELKNHEVMMIKQRLEQTTHHKIRIEITELQNDIHELKTKMLTAKCTESESAERAKQLEEQLKDSGNIREKQLKDAENQLKMAERKAANSQKEWQKYEHSAETLKLEIQELQKVIESGEQQQSKAQTKYSLLEEESRVFSEELNTVNASIAQLQEQIRIQKNTINQQNKQVQKLLTKKDDILKESRDFELDIKKLNHQINSIESSASECKQKIKDLLRKNQWISQDEAYFGEAGGIYDFKQNDPTVLAQKLHQLESHRDKLSKNVNKRAINLLSKEEERFNETVKKRKIVENDKKKILDAVNRLEEKKKETLLHAWEQVNRDFGSIFSSLLPGANAKLEPISSQNVLDGLEVKVGFSGVWKESLGELSGGQRSLVALSLILAMLLFKPAPLYILDEVDAALDLSHTQNIGTMLKRHFKHSQFIIVSLKDGMFNNANVLFTTKFIDGMSTITRAQKIPSNSNL